MFPGLTLAYWLTLHGLVTLLAFDPIYLLPLVELGEGQSADYILTGSWGNDALKEGQAGKAQRQLERAVSQCAREGQKVCAPFAYELTYSLGRSLQAQGRYADAMTEYEKLHKVRGGSSGQKREVATAMKELGPRLGKVTVLEKKKGKCQATAVFWLTPGQQTVRYGKASFQVKLRAQESQSVSTDSSCNADK